MSTGVPIPFFPSPPRDYDQAYFAQLIRNFSVFAQQSQVPGPLQASTLVLTNLPVFTNNADAIAGGLGVDTVYRTSGGSLRIVV